MEKLALLGGKKTIEQDCEPMFHWPIVTDEDLEAVNAVIRSGKMSGTNITKEFEKKYAEYNGTKFALGTCNGTAALTAAIWACGVGAGDEVIAPSLTYWASCASVLSFGATVNFADCDPNTLCIDPKDIEHRIGPKTKAIIVVNYGAMPADWDAILPIAKKHGLKIIEDNSHAHGTMYKGKMCGSFGDIAGASMMAGKSFAIGEAGMITTDNRELYERCIAFGHYERTGAPSNFNPVDASVTLPELKVFRGLPMGGVKHRMNQTCAAMGLVQLKYYPERIAEIQKCMNYFCDELEKAVPAFKMPRPPREPGYSKGGWYVPFCCYDPAKLGGLSAQKFADAVRAEGCTTVCAGCNAPLHSHYYFHNVDYFHQGKPTALAFGQRNVLQGPGALPVTEACGDRVMRLPWFKHFDKALIDLHLEAFKKVAANAKELL